MPILTLTSDFGNKSFDVAALKGKLLRISEAINIIDISHEIPNFDTKGAAYALKNASIHFPKDSIHFTNINLKEGKNRILIVSRKDQYYICPDNGIISMMFPDDDFKAFVLNGLEKDFSFREVNERLFDMMTSALTESNITQFGTETTSYLRVPVVRAALMPDMIRASVSHIDQYENAVLNVTKDMFYQFIGDSSFVITFRTTTIKSIHKHYDEVTPGEVVCIFNDEGYLEIAIARGKSTQLLALEYGSIVLIEKT